jgi:hypothetical protein
MYKSVRLLALGTVTLLAIAGVSAATLARQSPAPDEPACLAIAQGVCLSGTTHSVAQAARVAPVAGMAMSTIVADAN